MLVPLTRKDGQTSVFDGILICIKMERETDFDRMQVGLGGGVENLEF